MLQTTAATMTNAVPFPMGYSLPGTTQPAALMAKDYEGSNTYMTRLCKGCCPYLPHRGGFGNDLTCRTCGNTGHKPGCQAR